MRSPAVSPVTTKERIEVLDIIRGFALFGVLLVNMVMLNDGLPALMSARDSLNAPWLLSNSADRAMAWGIQTLFLGKFYTIFAFLFGLGFHLFLHRRGEPSPAIRRLFKRRLAILAVIGLLHLLLVWFGDILFSYAMVGFLLLYFVDSPAHNLRRSAIIWLLVSFAITAGISLAAVRFAPGEATIAVLNEQARVAMAAYTGESYWSLVAYRWRHEFWPGILNPLGGIPRFLGLFLLGAYAGKSALFTRQVGERSVWRRIALVGGTVGLSLSLAQLGLQLWGHTGFWAPVLRDLSLPFLSAFYVAGIVLLHQNGCCRQLFGGLAALGRMALTNYLVQCIALAWIFYGHGLGLIGMRIIYVPVLTVLIYALQIVYSRWWLARYPHGPAEHLWRRLTYGEARGTEDFAS